MNLDQFYIENPARKLSGEADYGVWWIDGPDFPRYRVSYIQATGEVYALNHSTQEVEVLGIVEPDEVIDEWRADKSYYRTLDGILSGWEVEQTTARQLSWVRERLATR